MSKPAVIVRPRRAPPVLVCRKCLKRCGDGRAIRRALKAELKQRGADAARDGEMRKLKPPKLVLAGCFGVCPKRAATLASGVTLSRGEFVLVRDESEVGAAVDALMPLKPQASS
jgi:hypothetical protein